MTTHVITGGTGAVGAALILELLAQDPSSNVVGLVRANDDEAAARRLRQNLADAAEAYGCAEVVVAAASRVRAVAADIAAPVCGVSPDRVTRGRAVVWHAAGSAQFQDKRRDVINLQNVEGTVNVLDLAGRLGAAEVNYVSSAQVHGSRTGVIAETDDGHARTVCNVWEASKVAAEQQVRRWSKTAGTPVRVLRLALISGHSGTNRVFSRQGMYAVTRALLATRILCGMSGMPVQAADLTVVAHPEATVNMIPVDIAARNLVACGLRGVAGQTYHITNDHSVPWAEVLSAATQAAQLPNMVAVSDAADLTPVGRFLDTHMAAIRSYLVAPKQFDTVNTRAVVGDDATSAVVTTSDLATSFGQFAEAETGPVRARLRVGPGDGPSLPVDLTDRALEIPLRVR